MRRLTVLFLVLLLGPEAALADGKFFAPPEEVPAGEPYQRAFLAFDGERECLVVQSQYELAEGAGIRELGWVVPVPAVPELGSFLDPGFCPGLMGWVFFSDLDRATRPEVVRLAWIWKVLGTGAGLVLLYLVVRRRWGERCASSVLIVALSALLLLGISSRLVFVAGTDGGPVEILKSERIGIYDVDVIRADQAGSLIGWLEDRGFGFGAGDAAVVGNYLSRGWCFVAARIAADKEVLAGEGLADPLVLEFPTPEAVYPLALTGAAGVETEILLYVLARHRMDAPGLLPTRFAGPIGDGPDLRDCGMEPPFLKGRRYDLPWLTKLKGTLTPAQMAEDLVLTPAAEDKEYRETIYVWE